MRITYIHHSGFLVETRRFYYLLDYESGALPEMDPEKPVFVLSSHSHGDHYRPEVFSLLADAGMQSVRAVLSHDIVPPAGVDTLSVLPNARYTLNPRQTVTTFRSTDLGVAFLVEDEEELIYHAGDLGVGGGAGGLERPDDRRLPPADPASGGSPGAAERGCRLRGAGSPAGGGL